MHWGNNYCDEIELPENKASDTEFSDIQCPHVEICLVTRPDIC